MMDDFFSKLMDDGQQEAGTLIDQIGLAQIPARKTDMQTIKMTKSGGDFEPDAAYLQGSVAFPLHSSLPDGKGQPQDIADGTGSGDVWPPKQPVEGRCGNFFVVRTIILHLYPGLGGPIQELKGQSSTGEHGDQPPFELAPEAFLFAVLIFMGSTP